MLLIIKFKKMVLCSYIYSKLFENVNSIQALLKELIVFE